MQNIMEIALRNVLDSFGDFLWQVNFEVKAVAVLVGLRGEEVVQS